MIPRSMYQDKTRLKVSAAEDAYKRMWYDIYRQKMRYDVRAVQHELDLDSKDIEEIERYYKIEEESEMPVKFVTINLPPNWDSSGDSSLLQRCLKKCYVGDWHYCFEMGQEDKHPHYHVYFTSTVKWLARSRIVQEWSKIFGIKPGFINVKSTSKEHIPSLENYISKEGILKKSKKHSKR